MLSFIWSYGASIPKFNKTARNTVGVQPVQRDFTPSSDTIFLIKI